MAIVELRGQVLEQVAGGVAVGEPDPTDNRSPRFPLPQPRTPKRPGPLIDR